VLGFFSVPVIVLSVAIFRAASQTNRPTTKLSARLAPATFGIYLVHVAVLIGLREAMRGQDESSPFLVNVIVGTVVALGLSYAITLLMQKTPLLRRLV